MFRYGFFNTVPMTSSERSKYSVQRKLKNEASRTHISDKDTCPNQTIQIYQKGFDDFERIKHDMNKSKPILD